MATSSKHSGGNRSLPKSKEGSPTKSSMGDTGAPVESENGLPTSEKSLLIRKDHKFRAASSVRGTGDANGSKHAFPKNTGHITMHRTRKHGRVLVNLGIRPTRDQNVFPRALYFF